MVAHLSGVINDSRELRAFNCRSHCISMYLRVSLLGQFVHIDWFDRSNVTQERLTGNNITAVYYFLSVDPVLAYLRSRSLVTTPIVYRNT